MSPSPRAAQGRRPSLARTAAFALVCSTALSMLGCTFERSADFPTKKGASTEPRRPDAVAIDLEGSLPSARERGSSDDGLVPLREPVSTDRAMTTVRDFFGAIAREDTPALHNLLASEATIQPLTSATTSSAQDHWDRRIRKLDYLATGQEPLFHESAVELYRYRDLHDPLPGRPSRPSAMTQGDVLIRVPLALTRIGIERLFGDEMLIVLRKTGGHFRIQHLHEDFDVQ